MPKARPKKSISKMIDADDSVERGCDVSTDARKAAGVDPEIKSANLKRLRRIEGQVRGLQKMIEEDRYCADIMMQISSVHEALRGVQRSLLQNHLKHCVSHAVQKGEGDKVFEEVIELMFKHSR